jgi:hypothetical protein
MEFKIEGYEVYATTWIEFLNEFKFMLEEEAFCDLHITLPRNGSMLLPVMIAEAELMHFKIKVIPQNKLDSVPCDELPLWLESIENHRDREGGEILLWVRIEGE